MVGRSACGQGADVVAVKEAARLCCRCSSQVCSVVLVVVVDVFFCVYFCSVFVDSSFNMILLRLLTIPGINTAVV